MCVSVWQQCCGKGSFGFLVWRPTNEQWEWGRSRQVGTVVSTAGVSKALRRANDQCVAAFPICSQGTACLTACHRRRRRLLLALAGSAACCGLRRRRRRSPAPAQAAPPAHFSRQRSELRSAQSPPLAGAGSLQQAAQRVAVGAVGRERDARDADSQVDRTDVGVLRVLMEVCVCVCASGLVLSNWVAQRTPRRGWGSTQKAGPHTNST